MKLLEYSYHEQHFTFIRIIEKYLVEIARGLRLYLVLLILTMTALLIIDFGYRYFLACNKNKFFLHFLRPLRHLVVSFITNGLVENFQILL